MPTLAEQSEVSLLRLREGDRESFAIVYDLYVDVLYAFVIRFTKSRALTDDIVQDVFVKVWERREQLDPGKSFKAYLFKIAKNQILNLYTRYSLEERIQKEVMSGAQLFSNAVDDALDFKETAELLSEGINQLPPQQKRIFELCKTQGLTYEQAAAQLNLSIHTVNTQMVNSLRFLRNYLVSKGSVAITLLVLISE